MMNTHGGTVSSRHMCVFQQVGDVHALHLELQERPALGRKVRKSRTLHFQVMSCAHSGRGT